MEIDLMRPKFGGQKTKTMRYKEAKIELHRAEGRKEGTAEYDDDHLNHCLYKISRQHLLPGFYCSGRFPH